jgi:hypothetical protein
MPDKPQESLNFPPPTAPMPIPEASQIDPIDEKEEAAKKELARTMPSKERLRELAKKNPPLPKWFDEEEEAPF